jgi:hypothetical protein
MPAPQYFILRLSFKVCYSLQVWNHLFFFIFSPAAQTPKTASHAKPNHAVALIRGTRPEMSSPTVTSIFGWPLISTSFRVCSKSQHTSYRAQQISFCTNSCRSCVCSFPLSRRVGFDDWTCSRNWISESHLLDSPLRSPVCTVDQSVTNFASYLLSFFLLSVFLFKNPEHV